MKKFRRHINFLASILLFGSLLVVSGCAVGANNSPALGRVTVQAAETGGDKDPSGSSASGQSVQGPTENATAPEQAHPANQQTGQTGDGGTTITPDGADLGKPPATAGRPQDEEDKENPYPVPPPDPPGTAIHPFYQADGVPPSAPGLALRKRIFYPEPAKIAYLTFDDGPYPETTPRILKILQDKGVYATFFVIGSQVRAYPGLLKAEYDQGNAIGNHTYSHDYKVVYRSPEAFVADVRKNEALIDSIIGLRPHIVRAPGGTQGHFSVNYFNALDVADYMVYDWNVSSGDAAAQLVPANTLVQNVETEVTGKTRVIILMHDAGAKTTTVDALPRIIDFLKEKGFAFGVLTPHVAPIVFPGGFYH